MKCPRCGNDNTIKNGIKYGSDIKQRWYCHGCRRLFYSELDITKPVTTTNKTQKEVSRILKGAGKDIIKKTR